MIPFGPFTLDPASGTLRRNGTTIPISHRAPKRGFCVRGIKTTIPRALPTAAMSGFRSLSKNEF